MNFKRTISTLAVVAVAGSLSAASWPEKKPIYMISTNEAAVLNPIATTGDVISGTVIRGIPDGMGAFLNDRGGLTVLASHEVSITDKIAARSMSNENPWGVSITKMNYSLNGKAITSAEPLIKKISFYNYKTGLYQSSPLGGEPIGSTAGSYDGKTAGSFGWGISRFCSATYSPAGTFMYNGIGYEGGLYTAGEEVGDNSRGFGFDMDGNGYQLPRMGMLSFENIIPSTKPGPNTVVLSTEDGSATDSQLHLYIGKKQSTGTSVDKAGLTNGDLYVLNVPTITDDNILRSTVAKSTPVDATFKKIEWNASVADFSQGAKDNGFRFSRIEDGNWDPNNSNIFYFLTTESNKDPVATKANPNEPTYTRDGGALWRLTFKDAQNPLLGAKLEMLLNGGEAPYLSKPDNLTVTKDGIIMIQEDPGNNAHVARLIAYRIKDAKLAVVAQFDPKYFTAEGSKFMTLDEESSGIIDVSEFLRKGNDTKTYFMLNAQIHTYSGVATVDPGVKGALSPSRPDLANRNIVKKLALDTATVEGGQFYTLTISNWDDIFKG